MRRALLVACAVALLAAPARPAPEDLGDEAGRVLLELFDDEWDTPSFALPNGRDVDVDLLPEPARPFVRDLLQRTVTIEVAAFRRRGRGAADAFLAGDAALADAAALAALRAEIDAGTLVEVGRTVLSAEPGEPVSGDDLDEDSATLSSDIEAAIGVSVTMPKQGRVRTGLSARMLPCAGADGAWSVRYRVVVGADAEVRAIETVAGPRASARVEAFSALGAAELRQGDCAVVRGTRDAGDGFVVLLRARELPRVRLPQTLGAGWVALPGALRDGGGSASLGQAGLHPTHTWELADLLEQSVAGAPGAWTDDLPPAPADIAWDEASTLVLFPDVGVCFARAEAGAERDVAALADEALHGRSARTLTVAHPGSGRIVVPAQGGCPAHGSLGFLRTEPDALNVETGCDTCISVADWVGRDGFGLAFAAVLDGDGGLSLDACARTAEERTERTYPARRSLPGHASITHDEMTVPFLTDRILRVRTRVPAGGARVAGEIDVAVTGAARRDPALRPLDVDGRRLWLAPGERVLLRVQHRTPHVVDWAWDASCGMTYRYPLVSQLASGTHAVLQRRADGALDVSALVTCPPNVHDPAFDMQDGVIEVLRQPFLLLTTTLPAGDLGRVARGAGCELRIDVPDAERAALRRTTATAGGESWWVRHADGAPVVFASGGTWYLPESIDGYVSNHQSGEAVVAPVYRDDGVHLVLGDGAAGVAEGLAAVRSRIELRRHDLTKFQAPSRPDTGVSLLLPALRVRHLPVFVPLRRAIELETPGGLPDPVLIRSTAPSEEDDE